MIYASAVLALASFMGCDDDTERTSSPSTGGNAPRCRQGTFSIETTATGAGFAHPDGTPVTATFGTREQQTATTTVQGGAFSLSFDQPSETCNLGTIRYEPAALYIDVNRDGQCTLADDDVFVWLNSGGAAGGSNPVALSPDVEPCAQRLYSISSSHTEVDSLRDALRRLCPEVGDCLPFCRPPDPPMVSLPDRYGGFCGRDPGTADAGLP